MCITVQLQVDLLTCSNIVCVGVCLCACVLCVAVCVHVPLCVRVLCVYVCVAMLCGRKARRVHFVWFDKHWL